MIPPKVKRFLDRMNADYQVISHPGKRMDEAILASDQISNKQIAQVIIVKAGHEEIMVVLPAACRLDLEKLSVLFDTKALLVKSEDESARLFPDCERGAYPALGKPYRLPCFVDETLLDGADVIFSGGTRKESIRVNSDDYWRIAEAEVGDFRSRP